MSALMDGKPADFCIKKISYLRVVATKFKYELGLDESETYYF